MVSVFPFAWPARRPILHGASGSIGCLFSSSFSSDVAQGATRTSRPNLAGWARWMAIFGVAFAGKRLLCSTVTS